MLSDMISYGTVLAAVMETDKAQSREQFYAVLQKITICSELKTQPLRLGAGCYCGEINLSENPSSRQKKH